MKNRKYILLLLSIFFVSTIITISTLTSKKEIDKVLSTEDYSYLPKEAKNFIKEEYKKTGNILLTEKNKEEGKGYLNPTYVKYLTLTKEEQKKEEIIPLPTVVEYEQTDELIDNIPSKFDLRNVNGKRYVSTARDQGPLGICWSFATSSLLESHILNKNKTPYTSDFKHVSDRHFDYITSTDGIKDYQSEYTSYFDDRLLGEGGNFYITTEVMASGVGLIDYTLFKNDYEYDQLELNDVINYSKSLYEVNRTYNMQTLDIRTLDLSKGEDINKKDSYLNTIKSYIMEYGGAYVSTTSPQSGCAYFDIENQNYVIDNDGNCETSNHAMEVIGWDDDVEYTYCKSNSFSHDGIVATCPTNDIVTGKGVWILKNSWGEDSNYSYPYLAYSSSDSGYNFITDVNITDEKTWDNNYVINYQNIALGTSETEFKLENAEIKGNEKLNKIKFVAYNKDFTYNVTIITGNTSRTVSVSDKEPGLVTIDLSEEDIIVNSSSKIIVSGGNNLFYNTLYVFTNNIDTNKYIHLEDFEITNDSIRLYSISKNIPSNSKIEYKLYSNTGVDESSKLKVSNNIIGANKINTLLEFNKSILSGNYVLKTIYNDEIINSSNVKVTRDDLSLLNGNGTKDSPYQINNVDELYLLNNNSINSKYFILNNDIDLSKNTWTPIEGFSGNLDGNNHVIKGIKINNDSVAGLFSNFNNGATITNLILEEFDIKGNISGALVGNIITNKDVVIKNVAIKNSTINGLEYAGSLVGKIENSNNNILLENIFTDSYIESKNSGGIAGYIKGAVLNNIEVLGNVIGNNNSIVASITNNVNINNIISTVIDIDKNNELDKISLNRVETNINNYKLYDKNINIDNSIFSEWSDFQTNWKIETIDNIERIPVLKFVELEYIKLKENNLNVKITDKINIYDYILPNKDLYKRKLSFEGLDIDEYGNIKLKDGANELKIINMYDGGNYILKINVESLKYTVKFNANGANGTMDDIIATIGVEEEIPENRFIKDGYIFDSWNTSSDGTGDKVTSINFDVEENDIVTLYAIWKGKKVNIIFNVNEGLEWNENTCNFLLKDNNCTKEVTVGDVYASLPVPVREGYNFIGWSTSLNKENIITEKDIVTDNIVLYALWKKEDYNINKTTISDIPNQSYTAKYIMPTLNIKNGNEQLQLNKDYEVTYLNNKNVGTATILIKGIGKYTGEITKTFKIVIGKSNSLINSARTTTSITLKWSKPTGKITGYQLYMATSKTGKYTKIATIKKSSTTSYKKTKLKAGKTYYFKVRTYYKTKTKNYYSEYTSLVTTTAPSKPSIKLASNTSAVKVSWSKVSGASGYEVYQSTDKKTYTKVGTTSNLSLMVNNLSSAKTYYYKVRAYKTVNNVKINSSCSKVLSITTKPITPVIVNSGLGYNYITIKWDKISRATGYEIYRSTNGKTYTKIKTTTSLSYKNTSLKLGTNYYYKVRAYKTVSGKKVYSSYSNIIKLMPKLTTPKASITYKENSLIISYNSVSGADGYQIYRSDNGEDYELIKNTTSLSYKDLNIEKGKTYYYKIRAYKKVSKTYYYSYLSTYVNQIIE